MTLNEIVNLLRLISGYHPGFAMNDKTPAAWLQALGDLPASEAVAAVHLHYATTGPWIMPADIRRRVMTARGLLPPDPETAYEQAWAMNRWLSCRVGPEPQIHPTAMEAARAIGWDLFDGIEPVAHRRFVESYTPKAARAAEQALATPLPELENAVRTPKALEGGAGIEAARKAREESGPADVTYRRAEELRSRTSGNLSSLGEMIGTLGADARFLLPPGQQPDSEFGRAALRRKLREMGADQNPGEAMRKARVEIGRNPSSGEAASIEARRAAALRALEAMAGGEPA